MADAIMVESEEFLVTRRAKRSTAGNRMEAVLAEMELETNAEPMEEDAEFINDRDEQDEFGSDFESTDEEAAQEEAEAGEKAVQDEERRARKEVRSKLEKVTAAAHAKHRVTFDPQAQASVSAPKPKEPKRRVSLGIAVNAETGEVLEVEQSSPKKKRHSQRKHTILNTSATVTRLKKSEEKKAATPKKAKTVTRALSQVELIALALDNEEGNIVEHRDYLKNEEEKRRRARVVRATVNGPLLRWVSRGEEIKIAIPPPPVPSYPPVATKFPYPYGMYNAAGATPYGQGIPLTYPTAFAPPLSLGTCSAAQNDTPSTSLTPTALSSTTSTPPSESAQLGSAKGGLLYNTNMTRASTTSKSYSVTSASQKTVQDTPPGNSSSDLSIYNPYLTQLQAAISAAQAWPQPAAQPTERTEKVAKNYVVQELAQYDGAPKPSWVDTMTGMLGDHVKWDEVKVYVGKSKPSSRPVKICPITGLTANYLDPRTGVPYADLRAYRVLTDILNHKYIWSPALKCYVGRAEPEDHAEHGAGEDSTAMVI